MSKSRVRGANYAVLPLAVGLLAGCAAAMAQPVLDGHVVTTGKVTGRLVMEGGPIGPGGQQPPVRPIPGTVTFTSVAHRSTSIQVGTSGTFSVRLAGGRYKVSGKSPRIIEVDNGHDRELPCSQPLSVTVRDGHTSAITVACIVP